MRILAIATTGLLAALVGCASAGGSCSVTTFGEVMTFARCEPDAANPAKNVLNAHAERHVALGRRFGPFLGPWTAIRRTQDVFRGGGWSGPVHGETASPAGAEPREAP